MNHNYKVLSSSVLVISTIFFYVMCYSIVAFTLLFDYYDFHDIYSNLVMFFMGVVPTLMLIDLLPRGFSVVEFSEAGIKKTFLKRFRVQYIPWSEVMDVRFGGTSVPYLFISNSKIENTRYGAMIKSKNIIHVQYSKKVTQYITQYATEQIKSTFRIQKPT